ncbi:hypothetical protein ABMX48_32885 [Streptomyces cavourensis]|uniref:hypothetical protein n=1 Tax=unclassified Streptomyces TaxID=2593676 RepID=UPI0032DC9773
MNRFMDYLLEDCEKQDAYGRQTSTGMWIFVIRTSEGTRTVTFPKTPETESEGTELVNELRGFGLTFPYGS